MSGENFLLAVRLGFSLSLVFGLMWVAARVLRARAGGLGRARLDHLEVLERKPLGKGSSIAIVRVGHDVLAVGVTDNSVTLLGPADVDLADVEAPATPPVTIFPAHAAGATPASTPIPVAVPQNDGRPDSPSAAPSRSGRRSLLDTLRDRTVRHIPG